MVILFSKLLDMLIQKIGGATRINYIFIIYNKTVTGAPLVSYMHGIICYFKHIIMRSNHHNLATYLTAYT
jgi:hypothetical protein